MSEIAEAIVDALARNPQAKTRGPRVKIVRRELEAHEAPGAPSPAWPEVAPVPDLAAALAMLRDVAGAGGRTAAMTDDAASWREVAELAERQRREEVDLHAATRAALEREREARRRAEREREAALKAGGDQRQRELEAVQWHGLKLARERVGLS